MPSPILHLAAGYAIHRATQPAEHNSSCSARGLPNPRLLVLLGLSMLPDLDAAVGLAASDLGRYHNNFSHSLTAGVVVAAVVGGIARTWNLGGFTCWFGLALLSYELHVLMDFFTIGRGVMLLWPIASERFEPPFHLFYGLRWSDGWISVRHLWTLATEIAFAGLLMLGLRLRFRVMNSAKPVNSQEQGA